MQYILLITAPLSLILPFVIFSLDAHGYSKKSIRRVFYTWLVIVWVGGMIAGITVDNLKVL